MMNVKELRIGNWVSYDLWHGYEYCKVRGVRMNEVWLEDAAGSIFSISVTKGFWPISLTPLILEKCGFKDRGGWKGLFLDTEIFGEKISTVFQVMDGLLSVFVNDQYILYTPNPSLHQLQNLVYSLTGQELNYTP